MLLKKQILEAVPHEYLQSLADDLLGFTNVNPLDMLTLLADTYGAITQDDLEDNFAKLSLPWDPNSPIETVFTAASAVRQFATAGGDPISDATATREVLKTFEKSGVFDTAVLEWRLKPMADRTYANLLPFFRSRNIERMRTQAATGNKFSANAAKDPSKKMMDYLHYCWTHGASTNPEHTSKSCPTSRWTCQRRHHR
jgi:hypothetical protein